MPVENDKEINQMKKMKKGMQEKALLGHIANLLVSEALINHDEQIRFLALMKEEN